MDGIVLAVVMSALGGPGSIAALPHGGACRGFDLAPPRAGGEPATSLIRDHRRASVVRVTRRPPEHGSGRVWLARPVTRGWSSDNGGTDLQVASGAYGADAGVSQLVSARVGALRIGLDPWRPVVGEGRRELEAVRLAWLRREGYVGGIRTFIRP